jgi:thiamine pyrophosphate-dependent acetolactate synthase large subunit-like protein
MLPPRRWSSLHSNLETGLGVARCDAFHRTFQLPRFHGVYGVDAHWANTIEEIRSALQMALKQTSPALIEVETLLRI